MATRSSHSNNVTQGTFSHPPFILVEWSYCTERRIYDIYIIAERLGAQPNSFLIIASWWLRACRLMGTCNFSWNFCSLSTR